MPSPQDLLSFKSEGMRLSDCLQPSKLVSAPEILWLEETSQISPDLHCFILILGGGGERTPVNSAEKRPSLTDTIGRFGP